MDNKKATLELGTKPVGKLLVQYALPAIIAMTASSLYNMIDSIFIGQGCGPLAISGLAITFPFQNLAAAFGAGVGVGAATCISVKLGQKDYATAQRIFGINITLNLLVGIVFSIITLSFLNPILLFFGASKDTLPYAREYMEVILAGNVIQQMFFGLNAVLRAASKPKHAMGASMLSVLLNVILAPIFIWPLGMGIRGAAWATVISQSVALAWQCRLFSNKNEIMHFRRGIYRPESQIVKNIFAIGMSPFAMNVCACIVVIFINTGLQKYGGVNQGMFPITGYNYGARRYDRLLRLLKYGLCTGFCITTFGFILVHLFPYQCARLFTTDATLISISIRAIQINMLAFPLVGIQMITTGFFQGIGKAKISMLLSLSRQMLFLLPLLIVLPRFVGLDGIWISLPIADTTASILATIILIRYVRKFRTMASAKA